MSLGSRFFSHTIARRLLGTVCAVAILVLAIRGFEQPASAQLLIEALPTYGPPQPCPTKGCRAFNALTMDVDYTYYATDHTADVTALTADIEAQIDAVFARDHPLGIDGHPRLLLWTTVDPTTHECQHPDDAGILEIQDAELLESRHQYVVFGQQREEARLAFRILGCAGDERLRFPLHGTASTVVSPVYLSIYGTVGLITLLNSASTSSGSDAAVLGALAGNSSLEPDIGAHSDSNLRAIVRHRVVYGSDRSKKARGKAAPDSLINLLSHCSFNRTPGTIDCRK